MSTEEQPPARKSHHDIERIYGEAKLYIAIGSSIVGIIFTYFIWAGIPIADGLSNANYAYVQAVTLWVYYLCWILGCPFDAYYQKWVYAATKNTIEVRIETVLLVAFLIVAAILFLRLRDDERWFSVTFASFVIINVIGWSWILYTTRPIVVSSRERFLHEKDYVGLEELEIVNEHMAGLWQIWRFIGMVFIVGCLLVISFMDGVRLSLSDIIHQSLLIIPPFSSLSVKTISSLLPDSLRIIFVIFAEGVIWYKRSKVRAAIHTLESLEQKYTIELRS